MFDLKIQWNKIFKILYLIILLLYAGILIYGELHHELWRDELQAWTLARDLSVFDLFRQMQWEGHPCLWHLILMPFAKLGFPPITMGFISVAFLVATVAIILYKSPFHLPVKIAIVFSSPFLYFWSINSRVYAIIPFLISILCLLYPKRFDKPYLYALILALLTNTHIIMSVFVGIMSVLFFFETICNKSIESKKPYLLSIGIILLGILVLYLQISHSLWNNTIVQDVSTNKMLFSTDEFTNLLYKFLYSFVDELNAFIGIYVLEVRILCYILVILGIFVLFGFIFSFKYMFIAFISYLFMFLLHTFIWFALPVRSLILILYLIVVTWIMYHDFCKRGKTKIIKFYVWEFILAIICCISIPYGYKTLMYDIENPVSGSLATALFIEENLEDDATFICPIDYVATSITGYIDRDIFYSNIRRENFTFTIWDEYWRKNVTYNEFLDGIYPYLENHDNVYILFSKYFIFEYDEYIQQLYKVGAIQEIYKSPEGLNSESYWIYKFTDKFKKEALQ